MSADPRSGAEEASAPPEAKLGQAALSWAAGTARTPELVGHIEAAVARRRQRRWAASGAAAIALILGVTLFSRFARHEMNLPARLEAAALAPACQTLPDGSIVEARPGARLAVEFTAHARRVMLQTGEAHFTVTKDPQRPFIVTAGGISVRAIGTAFAVSLEPKQVEVLVTEGRVAVDETGAEDAAPSLDPNARTVATLDAGHRVVVASARPSAGPPPRVETLPATTIASQLAWRVPRVELADTPLGEVIPIFNRYAREKLMLDPALAQLRLGGALRADNTEALLQVLAAEFGIRAERRDGALYLRRN